MNRKTRRAMSKWKEGASGLIVPDAPAPHPYDQTETHAVEVKKNDGPPMSHSETREAFVQRLVGAGLPREYAEKQALNASIRAVRKEGYKL